MTTELFFLQTITQFNYGLLANGEDSNSVLIKVDQWCNVP